jgi:hypothetical protein
LNEYQQEQWQAVWQIIRAKDILNHVGNTQITAEIQSYIEFRCVLTTFQKRHFGSFCSQRCFENKASACCSKDGIVTFWADHVINAYCSTRNQIDNLIKAIKEPHDSNKCIYLKPNGCVWKVTPLGCALFLCDSAQQVVFSNHSELKNDWIQFEHKAKGYRWPDHPVLFDWLEEVYLTAGCRSTLMYINTSPGLLKIKRQFEAGAY